MNKDCKTCKKRKDCVNIGKFKEGNCLQYEMTIEAMNEEIEKINYDKMPNDLTIRAVNKCLGL